MALFLLRIRKLLALLAFPKLTMFALRNRIMPATEHVPLLIDLRVEQIWDVGANKGQFALISRELFPNASIYSFEPLRKASTVLKKNFSSDLNFESFNVALGSSKGKQIIYETLADDSSSFLVPLNEKDKPKGLGVRSRYEVNLTTFDEYWKKSEKLVTSLLKIDVQGFELEVLKGASGSLRDITYVYCECSFFRTYKGQCLAGEVIEFLALHDFQVKSIANLTYLRNKEPYQVDILFEKQPKC